VSNVAGPDGKRTRPRGFVSWAPRDNARLAVTATQEVLDEYEDHLPLTIRQIYYRLVAKGVLDKTDHQYQNLIDYLGRARRAQLIPFSAIRDDGFIERAGFDFTDLADAQDYFERLAAGARFDLQAGQPSRLVLWCEAQGMVPQLVAVARPFGVSVVSSGGFDSLTAKHDMAVKLSQEPHTVLHIGDHDVSGEDMHKALSEDLTAFTQAFMGGVEFERIAVTPEQIEQYDLPTQPVKPPKPSASGKVSKPKLKFTVQAEALPPDVLAAVAREAIESRLAVAPYRAALKRQEKWRKALAASVAGGAR
jgi:hypothetical protein